MKRAMRRAALVIGVAVCFAALWIVIPAPTYFMLLFGVGSPEASVWLALLSAIALALAVAGERTRRATPVAIGSAALALLLALSVPARIPATIRAFDAATTSLSATSAAPLRARPVVVADLFRGISPGASRVRHGIVFASPGGRPLALDVYQPVTPGRYPIVVQIYGGAWQRGDPSSNADFAKWLAPAGYVIVAIDYRHAPAFTWPAQLDDVDSALVWVRDHATGFDGDTSRVVLMGRSAGAHLALMAGYRSPPIHVRGVVSYYGPADLADAYRHPPRPDPLHARDVETAFLGGSPDAMPARYADASPMTYAGRPQPPTLLIYGRRDHIVEAKYGARLADTLRAHGTAVAYLEIPWAEHAFDIVFNGPGSQLALYYTERFVRSVTR